jgi:hypothetical protein
MNKLKDAYGNFRRHWKLFGLLAIMGFLCYRMFVSNYIIVMPVVKKDNFIPQVQLQNDLAVCSQSLDEAMAGKQAAIMAANPDLQ